MLRALELVASNDRLGWAGYEDLANRAAQTNKSQLRSGASAADGAEGVPSSVRNGSRCRPYNKRATLPQATDASRPNSAITACDTRLCTPPGAPLCPVEDEAEPPPPLGPVLLLRAGPGAAPVLEEES